MRIRWCSHFFLIVIHSFFWWWECQLVIKILVVLFVIFVEKPSFFLTSCIIALINCDWHFYNKSFFT
jgi:hypothetical protein